VPDLTLTVTDDSPWSTSPSATLRGDKPPCASPATCSWPPRCNWLVDHVRWDLEDDLSRVIGDAPAHTHGQGRAPRGGSALRSSSAGTARPRPAARPPAGPGQAG
jgi:ubiquinone biosynthesis protein UbiJ